MSCKSVIVNITNYNSEDTFEVSVRAYKSMLDFNNGIRKVATGPVVVINGFNDGNYQAAVRRTCAAGGVNTSSWQDIVASQIDCVPPGIIGVAGTGSTRSITWENSSGSYEYQIDGVEIWTAVSAYPLELTGLISEKGYQIAIRTKCGTQRSNISFTTFGVMSGSPSFLLSVIEKICTNGVYVGHRLRITGSTSLFSLGTVYKLVYGPTTIAEVTLQTGMGSQGVLSTLASQLNTIKSVFSGGYGYIDFIIKDPAFESIDCSQIPNTTGFSVQTV